MVLKENVIVGRLVPAGTGNIKINGIKKLLKMIINFYLNKKKLNLQKPL
jgi:hypothetical protein